MYLEESRAVLYISVIDDDLATHSLNLPTFTSIHPGGPYIVYWVALSASVEPEAFKTRSAIS